jgi:hypothetical protein
MHESKEPGPSTKLHNVDTLHLAHQNGAFPCGERESLATVILRVAPTGAPSDAAENDLRVATKYVSVKLGDENDTTTYVSFLPYKYITGARKLVLLAELKEPSLFQFFKRSHFLIS